jgi:hypothetical protein
MFLSVFLRFCMAMLLKEREECRSSNQIVVALYDSCFLVCLTTLSQSFRNFIIIIIIEIARYVGQILVILALLLTPQHAIVLRRLTAIQLVKRLPLVMEPQCSSVSLRFSYLLGELVNWFLMLLVT